MHRAQRARRVLAVDDRGDVALGRALRDRADADGRGAERAEHFRGDAVRARHAVADDGEDAAAGIDLARCWICPSRSSRSNAWRTTLSARAASASGIAKQIECSELPCEIRMTEMP